MSWVRDKRSLFDVPDTVYTELPSSPSVRNIVLYNFPAMFALVLSRRRSLVIIVDDRFDSLMKAQHKTDGNKDHI